MISAEKSSGLSGQCFGSQTTNFCVLAEAAAQCAVGACVLTSSSELQAAGCILESTKKKIPFLGT